MAKLVNLRIARKRAKRRNEDVRAAANRLAHGQSKPERKREITQLTMAKRDLEGHRIDKGGRR